MSHEILVNAGTIGLLILLEGLLSADNALVIALLVRHLPPKERRKALLVGLVGSFTMRFLALLSAKHLIAFWYLQAFGAAYLLYLPLKHFIGRSASGHGDRPVGAPPSFWKTVVLVELTDLVFAIDSILVAVAVSDNIYIVYTGAISGVVLLRFAAFVLVRMIEKWPGLEHMAYVIVAWVAVKLAFLSAHSAHEAKVLPTAVPEMPTWLFWSGTFAILILGTWMSARKRETPAAERPE